MHLYSSLYRKLPADCASAIINTRQTENSVSFLTHGAKLPQRNKNFYQKYNFNGLSVFLVESWYYKTLFRSYAQLHIQ